MKPESRFPIGIILAVVFLLIAELLIYRSDASEPQTTEHITPAYTAEQAQASALAIPTPDSAKPASLVVVTVCNQIVGIVAADTEGNLHPLNIEGLGDARLKSIIARIPQRLVVDAGCQVEPDRQPIF